MHCNGGLCRCGKTGAFGPPHCTSVLKGDVQHTLETRVQGPAAVAHMDCFLRLFQGAGTLWIVDQASIRLGFFSSSEVLLFIC